MHREVKLRTENTRIKALSAFMAGKSEHKELIREAFLILTKKCAQVMQEVQAGRAFPPFSPFLHSIQDTFFPLENMEVSDHVFSACI